jgi:hypothetical protein
MPVKMAGPASEWYVVQRWGVGERWGPGMESHPDAPAGDGGAVWIAYPEEDMQRASAALAVDGDVWVIDPVDTPELDDLLAVLGDVRGVVVLLDRHWRDADAIAERHDVPVFAPDWFRSTPDEAFDADIRRFGDRLPDTDYRARRIVDNRFWQEAALFDGETLVVPEALGTAEYHAPGEQVLGVTPLLRLTPPRGPLGGLGPERIVVGHGEGVTEGATEALDHALAESRRGAPRAFLGVLSGMIRG